MPSCTSFGHVLRNLLRLGGNAQVPSRDKDSGHESSKGSSGSTSLIKPDASLETASFGSIVDRYNETIADFNFWSEATEGTLRTLLRLAKYSIQDQKDILEFHRRYIVESFGPRPSPNRAPDRWNSFMTDDFSPLEWSWNWGNVLEKAQPTIRYSVEAIDRGAGLEADPWNMKATFRLIQRLERDLPGFDSSMFHETVPSMMGLCSKVSLPRDQDPKRESPSSLFMAFDLNGPSPTAKCYFVPINEINRRSMKCRGDLVKEFLLPYARKHEWQSLLSLLEFSTISRANLDIEPFMVAWDHVPAARNRVKIYFRSADTSFATVLKVLAAHDQDLFKKSPDALEELQTLWHDLFEQDPRQNPNQALAMSRHSTAGILYYYDVRPSSNKVSPKVYLPVKHYGKNDLHTTDALCSFFQRHDADTRRTEAYRSAVQSICSHRRLQDGRGLHTYVSCAVKDGSLDVTSYFNPELYHPSRRALLQQA